MHFGPRLSPSPTFQKMIYGVTVRQEPGIRADALALHIVSCHAASCPACQAHPRCLGGGAAGQRRRLPDRAGSFLAFTNLRETVYGYFRAVVSSRPPRCEKLRGHPRGRAGTLLRRYRPTRLATSYWRRPVASHAWSNPPASRSARWHQPAWPVEGSRRTACCTAEAKAPAINLFVFACGRRGNYRRTSASWSTARPDEGSRSMSVLQSRTHRHVNPSCSRPPSPWSE